MVEFLLLSGFIAFVILVCVARARMAKAAREAFERDVFPSGSAKALSTKELDIGTLPRVKVGYVMDGDTLVVARGRHDVVVRLDAIDCPEDGQHWGDTAKWGLLKMIGGREVAIEPHVWDQHGRLVATLYVWQQDKKEWLNVCERMVMLGHAWVMPMFYAHLPNERQDKLDRLQRWARGKRVGLWGADEWIPPWRWRKEILD